jgi:small nuclear ribonucleoprotein (snRNP)-like protein
MAVKKQIQAFEQFWSYGDCHRNSSTKSVPQEKMICYCGVGDELLMPHDHSPQGHKRRPFRKDRLQPSFAASHNRQPGTNQRQRHFKKRHPEQRNAHPVDAHELMQLEQTGSETAYFRSLIDSRAKVTVVLTNGERFKGRIRYYDRDCFSIGLSAAGPRIFLRKDSVCYILEEPQEKAIPAQTSELIPVE